MRVIAEAARHLIIAVALVCNPFLVSAQVDSIAPPSVNEWEVVQHAGKLIRIHGEYPENGITTLSELTWFRKTRGAREWHHRFGFPSAGASVVFSQFGNPEVLGVAVAAVPLIRFERPLFRVKAAAGFIDVPRLFIRTGLGLAWFSKPYDALRNPENLVIGSRFANLSLLHAGVDIPVSRRVRINFGLSVAHCSNAHMRVPNIGANPVMFSLGVHLVHPERQVAFIPDHPEKSDAALRPGFQLALGLHEFQGTVRPIGGQVYTVYGVSSFLSQWRHNGRRSIGIHLNYYSDQYQYIMTQELFPSSEARAHSSTIAVYIGREWILGKFGLFVQPGLYLYAPFLREIEETWDLPDSGWLHNHTSNRFGYRWYPAGFEGPGWLPYVGMAVKANGGTADFLEFSVGFSTPKKRSGNKPGS